MNKEMCHVCGNQHEMAITPFPFIDYDDEYWFCPYDTVGLSKVHKTRFDINYEKKFRIWVCFNCGTSMAYAIDYDGYFITKCSKCNQEMKEVK